MAPYKFLKIVSSNRLSDGHLLVEFSDGTSAIYTARELALLQPDRTSDANQQFSEHPH